MKNVTQDYINAVTDYGREWQNTVVIKNGNVTETYTSCSINIEEVFSDSDTLSMGRAFSSKLSLKLYEPQRTLSYQDSVITVTSKLKVNNALVDVSMGTFYPSEVITNDDYETLDIVAYDNMAKLDVPYEPQVTLPCTRKDVVNDICTQYGLEKGDGVVKVYDNHQLIDSEHFETVSGQVVNNRYTLSWNSSNKVLRLQTISSSRLTTTTTIPIANVPLIRGHRYLLLFSGSSLLNAKLQGGSTITQSQIITNNNYDTLSLECVIRWSTVPLSIDLQDMLCQVIDLTEKIGDEPMTVEDYIRIFGNDYEPINGTQEIAFGDEVIDTIYEGTVAETLGYMAGLVGKNAIFNSDNKLVFRWYSADTRFGSRWQDLLNIAWQDLDGTWATELVDIVNFDRSFQHQDGLSLNEGTFTINSITSGTADTVYTAGSGKGISFENPYITQELVDSIYANLPQDYKTFYVGTINTFGMPCAEVGDIVYAQMKDGEKRVIYISNNSWNLSGGCSCITSSVGVPNAEIEFSTESPSEKKLNKVRTALQGAITKATELINGARGGIFRVTDSNDDGVNDGWILSESETLTPTTKCIVANYEGIGLSSDGGQTMSDVAITHEGIVADAITSGQLTVGGQQNNVALSVVDAEGNEIGKWNKTIGLRSEKGVIGSMLQPGFGSYEPSGWNINTDAKNGLSSNCMSSGDNKLRRVYLQPYNNDNGDDTWIFSIQKASNAYEWNPTYLDPLIIIDGAGKITSRSSIEIEHDNGRGEIERDFYVDTSGAGYFSGIVQAYEFDPMSRVEYKTDIELSKDMLDIVNDTNIYEYRLKKDKENEVDKIRFGVIIGDEYNEHTPKEIVATNGNGVDLYSMVSVLWKAVQELSAKVDELENQVNGLEKGE